MPNWLDDFEAWADTIPTVPLYRRWAGVMAASAAIQRRRWLPLRRNRVIPNLYVVFVSTPGTGKTQAMNGTLTVLSYLRDGVGGVLPDSVTRASMLDRLAENLHTEQSVNGTPHMWVGASLIVDELSILLHEYDRDLISHWSKLWDNPSHFEESRRHSDKKLLRLEQPFLTLFAGVQPSVLGNILPEHAWTQGFCSRTIFAYSETAIEFDMEVFNPATDPERLREAKVLSERLGKFCATHSPMEISTDAIAVFGQWQRAGFQPAPTHEKLADYNTRRCWQVMRIAVLRTACDGRVLISAPDLLWAKALLEDTELGYHQMFLELKRASDKDVYEDVQQWMLIRYAELVRAGDNGIPVSEIARFLMARTASHKIDAFIHGLELGGMMERTSKLDIPGVEPVYRPTGRMMGGAPPL